MSSPPAMKGILDARLQLPCVTIGQCRIAQHLRYCKQYAIITSRREGQAVEAIGVDVVQR